LEQSELKGLVKYFKASGIKMREVDVESRKGQDLESGDEVDGGRGREKMTMIKRWKAAMERVTKMKTLMREMLSSARRKNKYRIKRKRSKANLTRVMTSMMT
jgi:hypothetical protein